MSGKNSERKHLVELTKDVAAFIKIMDSLIQSPSTPERGKRIARAVNQMEILNDSALHFGLGMSFRRINTMKERLVWIEDGTDDRSIKRGA